MPRPGNGLTIQVYHKVRDAILRGELVPGEPLSENALAERFGISRTPVREALQILAREGYIEALPSRGYLVPRLTIDDLREVFELRESLEGMAARYATLRGTDAEIAELERICQQYEQLNHFEERARIGTEFHLRIVAMARNRRLAELIHSINGQIVLARRSALGSVAGRQEEAIVEHRAILDAIRSRDPDLAEQQARTHVRISYEALLRVLR